MISLSLLLLLNYFHCLHDNACDSHLASFRECTLCNAIGILLCFENEFAKQAVKTSPERWIKPKINEQAHRLSVSRMGQGREDFKEASCRLNANRLDTSQVSRDLYCFQHNTKMTTACMVRQ